jgi:hypothetical protein
MDDYEVNLFKQVPFKVNSYRITVIVKADDGDYVREYAEDCLALNGWVISSVIRADNY